MSNDDCNENSYWIMLYDVLETSTWKEKTKRHSIVFDAQESLEDSFIKYLPTHKKRYKRRPLGLWLTWYSRSFFQFHVLQSFQASHNLLFSLSLFCRTLRQFWVWHWWWPPRKKEQKKNKKRRKFTLRFLYCSSVVQCKVVVFCIFCWDPRFFRRARQWNKWPGHPFYCLQQQP